MSSQKSLLVYRDLAIQGTNDELMQLAESTLRYLPQPLWSRDKGKELNWLDFGDEGEKAFMFVRGRDAALPSAVVCLLVKDGRASIANIVPVNIGQLSRSEYNAIFDEFLIAVKKAKGSASTLNILASQPDRPITDWLTPAAFVKLQQFSGAANQSTGSAHPADRKRWFDFIIQVHADSCSITGEMLSRWLIEVEHWPEDQAHRLASEFYFGRELLSRQEIVMPR